MAAATRSLLVVVSIVFVSPAQQPVTPVGVAPEWDVRASMAALAEQFRQFQPLLERAKPEEWTAKGAPAAYTNQLKSAVDNIGYLVMAADKTARSPEKLSGAVETYFRMESTEALLGSIVDAIRKYQSHALSERVAQLLAETANHREKLRKHIMDVAATREEEHSVMHSEAQRCRDLLTRQPPPVSGSKGERRRSNLNNKK